MSLFQETALLLAATALIGLLAQGLRQPLIVVYLLVGILAGPAVWNWTGAHEPLELLASMGVTVLLFVVGLKLDLRAVRQLGRVALATGLGQLAFTIVIGFLIALVLGMGAVEAAYVAVALTFSSTIIIVKLLSDKGEIDSLHGRIAMGFLIVQDIAVVLAMLLIGSQGSGASTGLHPWLEVLAKVLLLAALVYVAMRWLLPMLLRLAADSQELLLLFAVAFGAALAALGETLGFSKEVGAFLAGFALASQPYREQIEARLASLRDFLLLFFFVHLGMQLDLGSLGAAVPAAVVFSLFVLIGNPAIVMAIMGAMGYRRRTGFMAGLTVAQISEFSILFVAMGVSLGHVGSETLGLVTLVGLITITASTYMILGSQRLYAWLDPWLKPFERRDPFRERAIAEPSHSAEVVIFGMGRYGRIIAESLVRRGYTVLGIDFDPAELRRPKPPGLEVIYGDASNEAFVAHLPWSEVRLVLSALRDPAADRVLLGSLAGTGQKKPVWVTAHSNREAEDLVRLGADRVLLPFADAAGQAVGYIEERLQQRPADVTEG